jgi:uncharacterized membrane protein YgaE (UPF0421/DUF939 family)
MAFLNGELAVKYFFRFLHVFGFIAVGGRVMFAYLFPKSLAWQNDGANDFFYTWVGLLAFAGLVNTFILKPKEKLKEARKPWIALAHSKLILTIIFFTPLL